MWLISSFSPQRTALDSRSHRVVFMVNRVTPGPVNLWLLRLSAVSGPASIVGIATGYGLDGPGIESRWGSRFSTPVQTGPGAYPAPCTMGTGFFPGVKNGRGVTLIPHPLLVLWSILILILYMFRATLCSSSGGQLYLYNFWYNYSVLVVVRYAGQ